MSRASVIRSLVIVLAWALFPMRAAASPLFELVGADDAGFSGRFTPSGARAAYFNPALLLDAEPGASAGFFYLVDRLHMSLGARSGSPICGAAAACDVPELNSAGPESFRHADGSLIDQPTLPTSWLRNGRVDGSGAPQFAPRPRQGVPTDSENLGYLSLGLVQAPLPGRFVYGISMLLPLSDFMQTNAFYSDEREQFFSNSLHHELYGDRLTTAGLAFGAGLRIVKELSIGASFTLGITSAAQAPVYVSNLANLDSLYIDSKVHVSVSVAPHFGLAWQPLPALRITATVHSPQGTEIDTGFSYVIATGIEQRASQTFEHGYLPWKVGVGAELTLGQADSSSGQWTMAAGGTYTLWSDYRDRHDEQPSGAYAWSNMLDASLTVRYKLQRVTAYVSGSYVPSPVPDQTGRTNYVDSDRISSALGASYGFTLFEHAASVGVDAQLHRLLPRRADKSLGVGDGLVRDEVPDDAVGGTPRGPVPGRTGLQTNNPGFPWFEGDGWIAGLGARFTFAY